MKNKYHNVTIKNISSKQPVIIIIAMVVYLGIFGIGLFLGALFYSFYTWQGDELLYTIGQSVYANLLLIFIVYALVGFVLISSYFLKKSYRYVDEIIYATENLYTDDDQLITLSEPLKSIESQLNQTKIFNLNNMKAAKLAEQRKNDLVAYLAHDLKTPITSVIGYLTLLRDEPEISLEMRQRYTNISLDKAERLDDLINEFFEITRFNLTSIELNKTNINLSRMLNQLVFEFKPMLAEKNLTCNLEMADNISLHCDPDKLQRVFDNLLRNAVNYSYDSSRINITAFAELKEVTVVFENQGMTISEEKLSRIFEQFYRLDSSRTSKTGGSGLGLAIAKEIVELHKGTIHAESHDDLIIITITLPQI